MGTQAFASCPVAKVQLRERGAQALFPIVRKPWSSYGANALGRTDPVVTPHALYRKLERSKSARLGAYRPLFEGELSAELLQSLRDGTNGGFVLGSAKFERQIAAMVGRRTWKGSPGRPRKTTDAGD